MRRAGPAGLPVRGSTRPNREPRIAEASRACVSIHAPAPYLLSSPPSPGGHFGVPPRRVEVGVNGRDACGDCQCREQQRRARHFVVGTPSARVCNDVEPKLWVCNFIYYQFFTAVIHSKYKSAKWVYSSVVEQSTADR
jgi:hypothetical protein